MFRTQISLSEGDRQLLDVEAARTGRSMSALIRDAVQAVYGAPAVGPSELEAAAAAFGAWAGRDEDGAAWVERLRPGTRPGRSA